MGSQQCARDQEEQRAEWSEEERKHAEYMETIFAGTPYDPRSKPLVDNEAIRAFDAERKHMRLCSLCAKTILDALENEEDIAEGQ